MKLAFRRSPRPPRPPACYALGSSIRPPPPRGLGQLPRALPGAPIRVLSPSPLPAAPPRRRSSSAAPLQERTGARKRGRGRLERPPGVRALPVATPAPPSDSPATEEAAATGPFPRALPGRE